MTGSSSDSNEINTEASAKSLASSQQQSNNVSNTAQTGTQLTQSQCITTATPQQSTANPLTPIVNTTQANDNTVSQQTSQIISSNLQTQTVTHQQLQQSQTSSTPSAPQIVQTVTPVTTVSPTIQSSTSGQTVATLSLPSEPGFASLSQNPLSSVPVLCTASNPPSDVSEVNVQHNEVQSPQFTTCSISFYDFHLIIYKFLCFLVWCDFYQFKRIFSYI